MRNLVCAAAIWAALTQWASAGCTLELYGQFTVEHGRALTTGQINGKPVRVLINTGAALSFIRRGAVSRLGLQLSDTNRIRIRAFGSGGEAKVHAASIRSLQIGTFEWPHLQPYVLDDEEQSADAPEFILGDDVLSNFDTEFDLAHDKIRLFYMQGCQTNQVAYWAHTFSLADLEKLDPDNPQIIARGLVNARPIGARLISGSNVSMISRQASERAGVTPWIEHPRGHISWIGAQPMDDWIGTFDTLSIGSETMSHVPLIIADLYRVAEPGSLLIHEQSADTMLLGIDFFMAHRILVMPSKRKMVFTYNGGTVFRTKTE